MIFTVGTLFGTTNTTAFIAATAVRRTFGTIIMFTVAAIIGVVSTRNISAIVAGLAGPIDQSDIWTVRVIGIQDASDHCIKIRKPTLFESSSYCDTTITFTQFITTNMRVSYLFICGCWIWIKGNYTVRTIFIQFAELA
jgi:hypothetical protein